MIAPTRRALALAAATFPLALLPAVAHARFFGAWLVASSMAALAFGLDAALAVAPRRLRVDLATPATLQVGEPAEARLTLSAPRAIARMEVLLEMHPDLEAVPAASCSLPAGSAARLVMSLRAKRRGRKSVDELWCRWTGPLGLAWRVRREALARTVDVSPSLGPVRAAALRYFGSRDAHSGVQVERFAGDGSEFDALVEFVPGLDPRAISWKASARHRRLLCQDFRAERNHQVILALDTGHLMAEPLEDLARLDHAVTSALLLAWVSLRLGDRVGLYGFDSAARVWSEPQGGMGAFARLRTLTASLEYSTEESNFTLGLAELSARVRRRSLVVVFTDFVDSVTAELMVENLTRLARRQLVLFVALRDPTLDGLSLARPSSLLDLHRSVVASGFVHERERVLARLRRSGILCVDAPPRAISARLVNRYLEVKRRELIA